MPTATRSATSVTPTCIPTEKDSALAALAFLAASHAAAKLLAMAAYERAPQADERCDQAWAFQVQLEIHGDCPFVPRPNLRSLESDDWDERARWTRDHKR